MSAAIGLYRQLWRLALYWLYINVIILQEGNVVVIIYLDIGRMYSIKQHKHKKKNCFSFDTHEKLSHPLAAVDSVIQRRVNFRRVNADVSCKQETGDILSGRWL